jgi:thiaminase/transcriptional activator TenA
VKRPALSDEILKSSTDVWDRMQACRFVADIEADNLDPNVFRRYLVHENMFVETAILIFGYMLVKAPDLETRQRLVRILKALSEDQIAYFHDTFEVLGMEESEWRNQEIPGAVAAFRDGMLANAAHGTYAEIVASMFAAEWMYWTWCMRASLVTITDTLLREWVELHTREDFTSQASWLREQLDQAGNHMDEPARERIAQLFRRVLELEIHFHDAAYLTSRRP